MLVSHDEGVGGRVRPVRSILGLLLLVVIPLTLALSPAVAMQPASEPATLDDLFDLFDVADFPADFAIVVDTSGSMSQGDEPPYPGVLKSYDTLVASIPDGDFLSVVTFDSDPNLVFQGTLDRDSRTAALGALPDVAEGSHTDIGAAIDATLRRLERADSSEVQTVIFITDGVHDPPPGSAYPETSGPGWDDLRARALQVAETRDVAVVGIGLVEGTDVGLLRSVFDNPQIISLPPEQLPDFFEEAIRQSRLARLRILVDRELEHGIRVRSATTAELASSIDTQVTLVSTFMKLPVFVTVMGVTVTDDKGVAVVARPIGDETFRLEPGASVNVPVLIKPDVSASSFTVPPETELVEFTVGIDATYTVAPAPLLRRVTTNSINGVVTGTGIVETSRTFGWTVLRVVMTTMAGLLILLILWWLYRRFLQLPRLVGVFEFNMPGISDEDRVLKLKGKRMILDSSNVPMAQTAKVKLFTRRGHPGHVWASVVQPPFYQNIGPHREQAIPDEIEIRFGEYRLGGGRLQYRARASSRQSGTPVGGH